jgi:hypothetical protein
MEISPNHSIVSNTVTRSVTSTQPISTDAVAIDPDNADMSQVMTQHLIDASSEFDRRTAQRNDSLGIDLNTMEGVGIRDTVSDNHFSAARGMGELDLNAKVDSAGSPMELVDKVTEQMEDLGRTALLTQTNQLPPVAMSLGE